MAIIAETNVAHFLPKSFQRRIRFKERSDKNYIANFLSGSRYYSGLVITDENFKNLTYSAWYFSSKTLQIPGNPFSYHFTFNKESINALSFLLGVKTMDAILQFFNPILKKHAKLDETGRMHKSWLELRGIWDELRVRQPNTARGGLSFNRNKKTLIYRAADVPMDETSTEYLSQIKVLFNHSSVSQESIIPLAGPGFSGEQIAPYTFKTAIPWIVDLESLKLAVERYPTRFPELAQEILEHQRG